jgi:uncharacterized protein
MRILQNERVPSLDGVELATDVFLPDGDGPWPGILTRIPYSRKNGLANGRRFTDRGYAYAIQDVRGKYDSDGDFVPLEKEAVDGHATIDWVSKQPWCNGDVGMWGRSYFGMTQIFAASGGHPALRCIAPSIAPMTFFTEWFRHGGCLAWANGLRWLMTHAVCRTMPVENHFEWEDISQLRTIEELEAATGTRADVFREWITHDTYDQFWQDLDMRPLFEQIGVPALHTAGWFDHISKGQFQAFRAISDSGTTEVARSNQHIVVGPWGHISALTTGEEHTKYGDWSFGREADLDLLETELQFYDYHIRGVRNGWDDMPRVRTFVIGPNTWRDFTDWPPPEAETKTLHLDSGGTLNGNSPTESGSDDYTYDPADPVPNWGGPIYWGHGALGPVDQRPILGRPDVLLWRSDRLEESVTLVGEIDLHVWITTDVEDTDIVAKFCVEEPSGNVTVLTNGSMRARFRESWSEPVPLTPGEPTELCIDLGRMGYRFPVGSRMALILTSSEFPRILPHTNRYESTLDMATRGGPEPIVAHTRILHGPETPSRVEVRGVVPD